MKLNTDLIISRLSQKYTVDFVGIKTESLSIQKPEFIIDGTTALLKHHLYVNAEKKRSANLEYENETTVICYGNASEYQPVTNKGGLIIIKEDISPFEIMNELLEIFRFYETWELKVLNILQNEPNIEELMKVTYDIFESPLLLLDAQFQCISRIGYDEALPGYQSFEENNSKELSLSAMSTFFNNKDPMMNNRDIMLIEIMDLQFLAKNLFVNNEYAGSITVVYNELPYTSGQKILLSYFSEFLEKALEDTNSATSSDYNILRTIFSNIICGLPIESSLRNYVKSFKETQEFICLLGKLNNRFSQIPPEYVSRKLESIFPKSISFEYQSRVICFIDSSQFATNSESLHEYIKEHIFNLTNSIDIKVGLSDSFTNLYDARQYYNQANAAIVNGVIMNPEESIYYFTDYALIEMITSMQNAFPLELYFPSGLKALFEHDEHSKLSYVETLKTYLKCNMSVSKTAYELFVHRSTLLERLERIDKILGLDLQNPDVRLQIQILLRAIEIRDSVQTESK